MKNLHALRLEIKLVVDIDGHVEPWAPEHPYVDAFWGVYVVGRDGGMRWHVRDYKLTDTIEMQVALEAMDLNWMYAEGTPHWPHADVRWPKGWRSA